MNGPDDTGDTGGSGIEIELDTGGGHTGGSDDVGFDIGASVEAISKEMAQGTERTERAAADAGTQAPAPTEVLAPPKSWAADKHELWKQLPRPAQEYYNQREKQMLDGLEQYKGDAGFAKQMREIVNPYLPMLRAQGVSEHDAVKFLMNAHYRLTNGTPEERHAAYQQLGKDLGLQVAAAGSQANQTGEQQNPDPLVNVLQQRLGRIESQLTAEQRARHEQARAKADDQVKVFAADKANLYFDEVATDMVGFINQGLELKDAYDKAVWANPVTRAKEIARLQTEEREKLKTGQHQTEAARRAASVNSRGTETQRAPTETKGKFLSDESLKDDLRKIRARAN